MFAAYYERCKVAKRAEEKRKPGYPSDGEVVANPRFLAASAQVIADLQRRKARAQAGSGNRKRIGRALAREWHKVRNRRRDFHHKTARALVNQCDAIALEDLNTAGMTKRPAPKPDPDRAGMFLPNQARAKAGLNELILDAGWAQFTGILTGKAAEAGRRVVLVNPAGTSIGCHRCGRRCERPQQKIVICPVHGVIDADVNGAATSRPGPGWALVRLLRQLEKLPPSGGRTVTGHVPPLPCVISMTDGTPSM